MFESRLLIGGWGLLAQKDWARVLVIVLGILHLVLVHFPFGKVLGVYTLWALLRNVGTEYEADEKLRLFAVDGMSPETSRLLFAQYSAL